jgi:hypothetical protein
VTISPARNACDDVVNLATAPVAVGRNHHLSCLAARRALHSHQMEQRPVLLAGAVARVCAHLRMPLWVYGFERVPMNTKLRVAHDSLVWS